MSGSRLWLAKVFLATALSTVLADGGPASLGAQELPLKRYLPTPGSISCPEIAVPDPPGEEERDQASRLGSTADQSIILGDRERARDLLQRATELDPSSGELAYRLGRVLQELGDQEGAESQFCRTLALGADEGTQVDARARLQTLAEIDRPRIPDEILAEFERGLAAADAGRFQEAILAFGTAFEGAPGWADAIYNRGVANARQGNAEAAAADFQAYLSLQPDAPDGNLVSQRIGQLQSSGPMPAPATALTLGFIMPGLGQFYSGRTLGGFAVMALAGSAAAAGVLVKEVTVRCVGSSSSGGTCPPERLIGESTDRPYFMYGLVAAGAVTAIGAVEAFVKARRLGRTQDASAAALEIGQARLLGPNVTTHGSRVGLNLVRIRF